LLPELGKGLNLVGVRKTWGRVNREKTSAP